MKKIHQSIFPCGHEEHPCQSSISNSSPIRAQKSGFCEPILFPSGLQYSGRRFLQQPNTAREQNRCHGPLPLFDTLMSAGLASKYSTYWPLYTLKNKQTGLSIDHLNPCAKTPPQVKLTIPISHELQLARQKQLPHCVPAWLVDAVTTWI